MPNGFPKRPPRQDFGPVPADRYPQGDPKYGLGADIGALILHQVAGSGLMVPLVLIQIVTSAAGGGTATILTRREAWNPYLATTGDYAPPGVSRTGVGEGSITYPANIPDHTGVAQPVVFSWGFGLSLDASHNFATCRVFPSSPAPSSVVTFKHVCYDDTANDMIAQDGTIVVALYS